MTLFGGRRRRAKQRDDVESLLANRALKERIGNEEGLLVDEIGAHFGMTDAEVVAAAHSNPAIESFEDVWGRGMRLRYIGFRHIAADFKTVADATTAAVQADGARLMAIVERVAAEIGRAPIAYNDKGEVFVHPLLQKVLDEPGNEGLTELLKMGAMSKRGRPPSEPISN